MAGRSSVGCTRSDLRRPPAQSAGRKDQAPWPAGGRGAGGPAGAPAPYGPWPGSLLAESVKKDSIPIPLRSFLLERISSVEQLEILLLLASAPGTVWNAGKVSRELRSSPRSALSWLENLKGQKILTEPTSGDYTFAPASEDVRTLVRDLAELYPQHRVSIIEIIFNKPAEKMRTFARAFLWRDET